ncbi:peptidase domain-containing ABC transporter [Microbacterium sp. PMB16]|uniref:peptidase domain-containing ABC transporter n=1 Tax=Microbacterium sp. PMB16 TaxID=3120157 RepID=UPI003F4BD95E
MKSPRPHRARVVMQAASTDCGAACLTMVLDALSRPARFSAVQESLSAGRDGVTARAIVESADGFGLEHRALRIPPEQLNLETLATLPVPMIAHTDDDHFVVVERVHLRRGVTIIDPAVGRMTIDEAEVRARFGGVILLFAPDDSGASRLRGAGARWSESILKPVIRDNVRTLGLALLLSAALAVLGLAVPGATAVITDQLIAGGISGVPWYLGIAVLAVLVFVLTLGRGFALALVQRAVGAQMGVQSVRTMLRAEYRFFLIRAPGDLVNRISSLAQVREIASSTLVASILDAVLALGYLAVALIIAPPLGLTAVVVTVALVSAVLLLSIRSRQVMRAELHAQSLAVSRLVDAVQGIASLKVGASVDNAADGHRHALTRELDTGFRRGLLMTFSDATVAAFRLAAPILFLVVAASQAPSPGAAVGLAALASAALTPAAATAGRLFALNELGPILERLADVMEAKPEELEPRRPAPRLTGAVELEQVTFGYASGTPAVSEVSLRISPGQKVAVVGATGSGKSTLVTLLTGLHRPDGGRVLYDGEDLNDLDLDSVRRQLGVVLQDPFIPAGAIRDAIAMGRDDLTDADIENAARAACMHDAISAMPLGYRTVIAQGGTGLSGGERQRLNLARALAGNPRLLILDEATSALDAVTEAAIEANLRELGVTRFVVAHRLSTTTDADVVHVFDRGRLVESGPPEQLEAAGGAYARLRGAALSGR